MFLFTNACLKDIGDISDITEVFSTEEMFSAIIERKANRIEEGL